MGLGMKDFQGRCPLAIFLHSFRVRFCCLQKGSFDLLFRDEAHRRTGWLVIASTWFLYSAQSCFLPHQTRFFDLDLGLDDRQIGILMAVPAFVSLLFQPVWGALADRVFGRTVALRIILISSSVLLIFYSIAYAIGGYFLLLFGACLFVASMGATIPTSAAIILSFLGPKKRHLFGRIRVAGSTSFCFTVITFCPVLALISQKIGFPDRTCIFWGGSIFYLLSLSFTFWDDSQFEAHETPTFTSFVRLLRNRNLALFYFSIFCCSVGASAGIQYIGPYIGHRGFSEFYFSSIWFVGVGVEIFCTYNLHRLVNRFGLKNIVVVGIAAEGCRWLGLSQLTSAIPILMLFMLHGPAVIGSFFGSAMYLDSECEESVRSTAQAILYFSMVAGQITGYLSGSLIVESYGYLSRKSAIQNSFFWFGLAAIFASAFCYLFVKPETADSK